VARPAEEPTCSALGTWGWASPGPASSNPAQPGPTNPQLNIKLAINSKGLHSSQAGEACSP